MAGRNPVPQWWIDELRAAIARLPRFDGTPGEGRDVDLAVLLVPADSKPSLKKKAVQAAKTTVSRFLADDPKKQSRSPETVAALRAVLGLPRFAFKAESLAAAKALEIAEKDPELVLHALVREADAQARVREMIERSAADRLAMSADSGAERTLGYSSDDGEGHTAGVELANEDGPGLRRRRGSARTGSAPSAKK